MSDEDYRIKALCVGGPLDGQTINASRGGFNVPIEDQKRGAMFHDRYVEGQTTMTFRPFVYELSTFTTSKGPMSFWVPAHTCGFDTLSELAKSHAELTCLKRDAGSGKAREGRNADLGEEETMMMREAPLIVYGDGDEDGPAFERLCPKCARFIKFPETMKWREKFNGGCEFPDVTCSRCGPVQPVHIGWASDFRNERGARR
jgi:hypothetical protein